mmetsp:Transcript_45284/g.75135  ORF Transcript_45284/g.75135 Transcript_45284/m.75135 type:complete len:244 (-) Transcript_45284:820-1551(-)
MVAATQRVHMIQIRIIRNQHTNRAKPLQPIHPHLRRALQLKLRVVRDQHHLVSIIRRRLMPRAWIARITRIPTHGARILKQHHWRRIKGFRRIRREIHGRRYQCLLQQHIALHRHKLVMFVAFIRQSRRRRGRRYSRCECALIIHGDNLSVSRVPLRARRKRLFIVPLQTIQVVQLWHGRDTVINHPISPHIIIVHVMQDFARLRVRVRPHGSSAIRAQRVQHPFTSKRAGKRIIRRGGILKT